ncbi:MAG: hypothetical protein M3N41_01315 [Acidobacteriota bacterium]|nr:hypothetical protein [Acidobacteriota bacterium]
MQSVLALTRGGQAPLAHGMTAMGDYSVSAQAPPSSAARTNVNRDSTARW